VVVEIPHDRIAVGSAQLIVPADADWETMVNVDSLRLHLETGSLIVQLHEGTATLHTSTGPDQGEDVTRITVGDALTLRPGDSLTADTGVILTAHNPERAEASAVLFRHVALASPIIPDLGFPLPRPIPLRPFTPEIGLDY